MYSRRATLPAIVTLARAGSLELAERLFEAGGFARRTDDAAALAVLGRLRKDRAARLPPEQRARAYGHAAAAYAAADQVTAQPYTRLNVATLSYLAGDQPHACRIAHDLIAWLDSDAELAETPYYLEATRAEALLLCGDRAGAAAGLARAIAAQPEAWQDHAATLLQFAAICEAGGIDPAFLDDLRPPRSLHYVGHLGIADVGHEALSATVAGFLRDQRIGFGFGALAAGAELVIAEQVVRAGAELHVFLPGSVEEFAAISVDPYGAAWRGRFESCLAAAAEVRCFAQPRGRYQPLGSRIAADVAMGAALMNAQQLQSEAVQLLIADTGDGDYGSGSETARIGKLWRTRANARPRAQQVLREPRNAPVTASGQRTAPEGDPDLRLAALIRIEIDGLDRLDEAEFAVAVHDHLQPLRAGMIALAIQPDLMLPAGNARIAAFADPARAWSYACEVLALPAGAGRGVGGDGGGDNTGASAVAGGDERAMPLRIAGHYGLAHWLDEPAALVGRALADLERVATGALPGVLTVSEPLARVLQLTPGSAPHVEHVGEVEGIELYAVTMDASA